jgi:hypothetical protein
MNNDYYGEEGCCLTCDESEPGCLCPACNCRECGWYESLHGDIYIDDNGVEKWGQCTYPRARCKRCGGAIAFTRIKNRWVPVHPTTLIPHICPAEIKKFREDCRRQTQWETDRGLWKDPMAGKA